MEKLTPENLRDAFAKLQTAGFDAVVVGGQAVNLWACRYCDRAPNLNTYLPFSSEDLDFYGGKVEAVTCQSVLGGEIILNQDFDPSPNAGIVLADYQDRRLRIDFLASVYGLNDAEITGTALTFSGIEQLAGIQLKVLHPVLCLEGKLRSLRGLPQSNRQDLKHANILILCVREFLIDLVLETPARPGLKLIERILSSALREDGLSAWSRHGIEIEAAIPTEQLQQLEDPKWQNFYQIRWPQALEQVDAKRRRYQAIISRYSSTNVQEQ